MKRVRSNVFLDEVKEGDKISIMDCNILFSVPLDKKDCVVYQLKGNDTEVFFDVSHTNSTATALKIRVFKDFLSGIEYTLDRAINALYDNKHKVNVTFKASKGICNIKTVINPVTKVDYNFPVNDGCSYGKTTFTVQELTAIRDALKNCNLL